MKNLAYQATKVSSIFLGLVTLLLVTGSCRKKMQQSTESVKSSQSIAAIRASTNLTSCPAELITALHALEANISSTNSPESYGTYPMTIDQCPTIDASDLDPTFVSQNIYTPVAGQLPVVTLDQTTITNLLLSCQTSSSTTSTLSTGSSTPPTGTISTTMTSASGAPSSPVAFGITDPVKPPTPPPITGKIKVCQPHRCDKFSKGLDAKNSTDLGVQAAANAAKDLLVKDISTQGLNPVFLDLKIDIDGESIKVSILYYTNDIEHPRELVITDKSVLDLLKDSISKVKADEAKVCAAAITPKPSTNTTCKAAPSPSIISTLDKVVPLVRQILRSEFLKKKSTDTSPLSAECSGGRCGISSAYIKDAIHLLAPDMQVNALLYEKLFIPGLIGHSVLFIPMACEGQRGYLVDLTFNQFSHYMFIDFYRAGENQWQQILTERQAQGASAQSIKEATDWRDHFIGLRQAQEGILMKYKDLDMTFGYMKNDPVGGPFISALMTKGYAELTQPILEVMAKGIGRIEDSDKSVDVTAPKLADFFTNSDTSLIGDKGQYQYGIFKSALDLWGFPLPK